MTVAMRHGWRNEATAHLSGSGRTSSLTGVTHVEVGQRARRTRTVTARDIELFTELTGDRNPLHYD